jgi:hypothetical protein
MNASEIKMRLQQVQDEIVALVFEESKLRQDLIDLQRKETPPPAIPEEPPGHGERYKGRSSPFPTRHRG